MNLAAILAAARSRKALSFFASAILLAGAAYGVGRNQAASATSIADATLSPAQRTAIEALIKEYLVANPEIIIEMQQAFQAKQEKLQAERTAALIKTKANEIFRPAFSPVVGNTKGEVPIVEFFDYNCGYCKRALGDMAKLVESEKRVRVILKELPILAPGSEEASKVALAAKMQGKYWEFHRAMLGGKGMANEASA
ncbi:MAG TPA: thioredoxin domain-containing protein, partial [Hyphomicrobiaceae bacterium]|nr:thioredoxin domain-containing protein [Hyphomicrobiaceae bacterium]